MQIPGHPFCDRIDVVAVLQAQFLHPVPLRCAARIVLVFVEIKFEADLLLYGVGRLTAHRDQNWFLSYVSLSPKLSRKFFVKSGVTDDGIPIS